MNKRTLLQAVGLTTLGLWTALASAQSSTWPDGKPIKLVIPYPAGGLTDIVSRTVMDEVAKNLGTSIVIDNKAGAGGQIGLEQVLQAPKDGYTIALIVPATMITLPLTNPNYKIRPLEQFEPITAAVDTFLTLVVDSKLGLNTVQDFAAYARKNSGKLNYGTPGVGTSFHFNHVMMGTKLGFDSVHVPYTGEIKVLTDIAGGQLQFALVTNTAKPFIESGQVKALAVSSAKRVQSLPQVPTFREAGIDFTSDGWVGYAVAKGTPKPVVDKMSAAFQKALANPAVAKRLTDMGYLVTGNTPEQFTAQIQEGTRRYVELFKSGKVKLD